MTVQRITKSGFTKFLLPVLMTTLLIACGGGGGGGNSSAGSIAVPANTVTLAWDAPLERADGSPLAPGEIAGYRIYFGMAEGDYPNRIDVNDGTVVQVTLTDLSPGTYYFVLTTQDIAGNESVYSSMASINL